MQVLSSHRRAGTSYVHPPFTCTQAALTTESLHITPPPTLTYHNTTPTYKTYISHLKACTMKPLPLVPSDHSHLHVYSGIVCFANRIHDTSLHHKTIPTYMQLHCTINALSPWKYATPPIVNTIPYMSRL